MDTTLYDKGHIPGAIGGSWQPQLADRVRRDILSKEAFEMLMREAGIAPETTIVLYGDSNNWFAAWAFWQMKVYGHGDVRMMDGGRRKWEKEGREVTADRPAVQPRNYEAQAQDRSLRAFLPEVMEQMTARTVELVDVRGAPVETGPAADLPA